MIDRRTYILLFCGLAGILCYFYLRPHIELYSGGPISESKKEVEERIQSISPKIGFDVDSMAMMSVREQHANYINLLRDTLSQDFTLQDLNEKGLHIQSWKTVIGSQLNKNSVITNAEQLYVNAGRLKVHFSNDGKLIRLLANPDFNNPTFVKGDSLKSIAENIVGETFGYNLDNYQLAADDIQEHTDDENRGTKGYLNSDVKNLSLEIKWLKNEGISEGPSELILKLEPVVREFNNEEGFRTEFGFSIQSFVAKNEYEPIDLNAAYLTPEDDLPWFSYLFYISLLILVGLIFTIGLRSIFKGRVEWRRALVVFSVIATGTLVWRTIYYIYSYNPFLNSAAFMSTFVNTLLFALVIGLYAALAYISWEVLARDQNQKQVDVIDSLWQRKLFVSETGAGFVNGFGIGGIAIGLMSVFTFLTGDYFMQADSQFGFAEAAITPKLFTINISAWTTTWLVCVAQIGLIYTIFNQWINRKWLSGVLSIIAVTMFTTVLGRLLGTSGEIHEDALYYFSIAIIFIYAIREFGLLTVFTGWWVFVLFFMVQPYWNSPSIEVAYVSWVQVSIMASVLVYGFIAYRYGEPVSEVGTYIPEYEERIKQHLRVEKEIEIARESQYKLMPLQPPIGEEFDVYGFFLPSFEVGGDYFDYVLCEDEAGKPAALTMAVVDVSGKSMRAAMPAVFTSGLLLSRMKNDLPANILSQVAEPIYSRTDKRTFITCALARYEFQSKKLSVANAGHCRPILKRNGIAEFIQTPDPKFPLGLMPDVMYQEQEITLKKGDFLLMYSDGLPEAVNEKGVRFGFDEVPRLVEQIDTDNLTAQEISQEIKRTVQKFSNYQLADDTTIICLKV